MVSGAGHSGDTDHDSRYGIVMRRFCFEVWGGRGAGEKGYTVSARAPVFTG